MWNELCKLLYHVKITVKNSKPITVLCNNRDMQLYQVS